MSAAYALYVIVGMRSRMQEQGRISVAGQAGRQLPAGLVWGLGYMEYLCFRAAREIGMEMILLRCHGGEWRGLMDDRTRGLVHGEARGGGRDVRRSRIRGNAVRQSSKPNDCVDIGFLQQGVEAWPVMFVSTDWVSLHRM